LAPKIKNLLAPQKKKHFGARKKNVVVLKKKHIGTKEKTFFRHYINAAKFK
jgi:hypothetical protein